MTGTRCAHVNPDRCYVDAGRCGRFVSHERAARGETLCSVHDPKCKEKTRAAHVARTVERYQAEVRPLVTASRDSIIAAIKELDVWWDGPGSEGRSV